MSASLPFTVMPCPCCGSIKIAISTTTNALTNLPRNDRPVCLECGVRAETLEAWNRRTTRPEALRIGATPRTNAVLSEVSSFFDPYRIVDTKLRDLSFRLEIELAQAKADLAEVDEANTRLARDRQTTPSPQLRSQEKT